MSAGYAPSCHKKPVQAQWEETTIRQIVWFAVLDGLFRLSGSVRVMNIDDEQCFMYYDIRETATLSHLIGINNIVTYHPAALAYSCCRSTSDNSAVFVTRQIFFKKLSQKAYLLPKFKVSRENRTYRCYIHLVNLRRIYLAATRSDDRMKTHSGKRLRNFAFIRFLFAPIKKTLAVQLNIINISDTDNSLRFIHTVNGIFKSYRLHQSVSTPFFYFCTCKKRYDSVSCTIDCHRCLKRESPFVACALNALYHLSVPNNIRYATLQKDIDILFFGDKLRQCEFGLFEIVSLSVFSNPVIVFDSKKITNLISHCALAHTAEDRTDISGGQVASDHSIPLYKSDVRSLSCGSYSCTYPGRTSACYYYIVMSCIHNSIHNQTLLSACIWSRNSIRPVGLPWARLVFRTDVNHQVPQT